MNNWLRGTEWQAWKGLCILLKMLTDEVGEKWHGPKDVDKWNKKLLLSDEESMEESEEIQATKADTPAKADKLDYTMSDFDSSDNVPEGLTTEVDAAKSVKNSMCTQTIFQPCDSSFHDSDSIPNLGGVRIGTPGPAHEFKE